MASEPTNTSTSWRRWLWPLNSRKVQVALATVIAAYTAELGLNVSSEALTTIVALGVALILGIAHEDAGKGRSSNQ